jgi:hypothetical protein
MKRPRRNRPRMQAAPGSHPHRLGSGHGSIRPGAKTTSRMPNRFYSQPGTVSRRSTWALELARKWKDGRRWREEANAQ